MPNTIDAASYVLSTNLLKDIGVIKPDGCTAATVLRRGDTNAVSELRCTVEGCQLPCLLVHHEFVSERLIRQNQTTSKPKV